MNEKAKKILFVVAGIFTLAGAIFHISSIHWDYTPYLYSIGTAGIAVTYLTNSFQDKSTREKRLQLFLVVAGLLLVISSYLMFHNNQEWIICVLISAILQLYVAFMMPKSQS